jgi:DNA polymerase I-like protein with 3'-5' exonuclease and polymerase domains
MHWFEQQRMEWITESLRVFGFINRAHLQKKFGISQPQASKDLQTYMRRFPHAMRYDLSAKRYEARDESVTSARRRPLL